MPNITSRFWIWRCSVFDDEVFGVVRSALCLAVDRLKGLVRHDGTPFVTHSINTAMIVIQEVGLGRNSTVSTLLHDVVRLQLMDVHKLGNHFGKQCVGIFAGGCATSRTSIRKWPTTRSIISGS